jgi:murein DD-endopeptidase MepM/ murein hydrolase activator NlpD
MARDDNSFTFVITQTEGSRSRLRRFTFHRNWVFALAGVGIFLLGAVSFGIYGLTQRALHQQTAAENSELLQENKQNQQQFKDLNERLKAAEAKSRQIAEMAATANTNQSVTATPDNDTNRHHTDVDGAGGPGWPLDWDTPSAGNDEDITPEELARRVALLEKKLRDYEAIIRQQAVRPSIWPVTGRLTDFYGPRRNPFGGGGGEFHPGQDIANAIGTPVVATANGKVIYANWQSGYGRLIEIEHGNGITTRYAHLSKLEVVEGQEITRGQLIGLLGSSGRSTGPHVHYEVRINDETVNPMDYLPREAWVEEELKK